MSWDAGTRSFLKGPLFSRETCERPEKKGPFLLFRVYVWDEILPSYVEIISYTIIRIPISQRV